MTRPSKPIQFEYDEEKAAHVILWFLHKHGIMDKLKIVKLIFFADRAHLARYGRPVVGGYYVAMPHGPVSSELLNHINQANYKKDAPFILEENELHLKLPVKEDYLSESDIEILEEINNQYGKYDSWTLRNITHGLKAYQKNYQEHLENGSTSVPLPYEDFFLDFKDNDMLDIIREDQEALADFE